jgi:hypothetical protein
MGDDMVNALDQHLLDTLLNSWDRNNTILLNLLRVLSECEPEDGLEVRAIHLGHLDGQDVSSLDH